MRIRVDAERLAAAVGDAVCQRSTLPILEHVLFTTAGADGLTVTSSDTQLTLSRRLAAEVLEEGAATAQCALLRCALKGVSGPVELRLEEEGPLLLIRGRARFKIPSLPAADFPLPEGEAAEPLALDGAALAQGLREVAYAMARGDVRYYLNAVHICQRHVAASDGHRIAWAPLPEAECSACDLIIDREAVPKLAALGSAETRFALARNALDAAALQVQAGDTRLRIALVQARYPDLYRLMPREEAAAVRLTVAAPALQAALERLLPFGQVKRDGETFCPVELAQHEEHLRLVVQGAEQEAAEYVPCTAVAGEGLLRRVNGRYLMDVARAAGSADLTLYLDDSGPDRPFLFRIAGRESVHVLMPMRG